MRWMAQPLKMVLSVAALVFWVGFAVAQPPPPPPPPVAPLPSPPVPLANPITEAKRVLGKILFWDEQLSSDNTMSCGTCHSPANGGSDPRRVRNNGVDGIPGNADDVFGSPGVIKSDEEGRYIRDAVFGVQPQGTGRASMTVINAAFSSDNFWDGRARTTFIDPQTGQTAIQNNGGLESQSVGPPLSSVEMAHAGRDWNEIVGKLAKARPMAVATNLTSDVAAVLAGNPSYGDLFAAAFGDPQITARRIAFALATYERTLIANDTPWDRFNAGTVSALNDQQRRGLAAFQASNCTVCHTPPMFSDQTFRNIGLRPPAEDLGRQIVTGNNADRGRFKVPTLRNAGLRTTFMHNGMFTSVPAVIGFYARAPGAPQQFPDNRDPVMLNVNVPPQAAVDIDAFIRGGLTDARVANQTFPFDRPTLYSQRPADRPANLGGGLPGSGGIVPGVIAFDPPFIGSQDFRVGLDGALGGATVTLLVSTQQPVGGKLLAPDRIIGPMTASGSGAGNGMVTFRWPILPVNTTEGQEVYVQWAVNDPAAAGGKAFSNVARIRYFCGSIGCPPVCIADIATEGSSDPSSGPDGQVTGVDFDVFVIAYFTELRRADQTLLADVADGLGEVGSDGFITGTDADAFVMGFFKGC